MKKFFDVLYMTLGTLCLFGMPAAMLGLSAWFGDTVMNMLHTGSSAVHSITFQLEAILILFGCSAGGLALSSVAGMGIWMVVSLLNRLADQSGPVPEAAGQVRSRSEPSAVGRIAHGSRSRR